MEIQRKSKCEHGGSLIGTNTNGFMQNSGVVSEIFSSDMMMCEGDKHK